MTLIGYDLKYSNGGFGYKTKNWRSYIKNTVMRKAGVKGRVLDAPCGDGFWGKMLRSRGCQVTFTDLSEVGCSLCGGTPWYLEVFNCAWEDKFDWVFCRGLSALHSKILYTDLTDETLKNLTRYARRVLIIYATNRSRKFSNRSHFNHSKYDLDECLNTYGSVKSFFYKGYYHGIIY